MPVNKIAYITFEFLVLAVTLQPVLNMCIFIGCHFDIVVVNHSNSPVLSVIMNQCALMFLDCSTSAVPYVRHTEVH